MIVEDGPVARRVVWAALIICGAMLFIAAMSAIFD
jgi:hypothetical protein